VIDWTKPVELTDDGTPVRVERDLGNGRVIVSWIRRDTEMSVDIVTAESNWVRNPPPKPREWWALVDGSILIGGYLNRDTALAEQTKHHRIVHVREVLED
jgi:hypothetical protein